MSSGKFASITSSLLARKGEAQPWRGGAAEPERFSLPWRQHVPETITEPPPPSPPAKEKSCSIRMSPHDFERLGILAIKTGASRQQLLKDALSEFLASRADDYGCYCLGACDNDCGKPD
jgi:hypothetical protein